MNCVVLGPDLAPGCVCKVMLHATHLGFMLGDHFKDWPFDFLGVGFAKKALCFSHEQMVFAHTSGHSH